MYIEQIDSASLHSVISALVRKKDPDWTDWERQAVAEVTLSLLFRANVTIPPPPKGSSHPREGSLVAHIFEILHDFVSDGRVSAEQKKDSLLSTKSWISGNPEKVREAYKLFKQDPSADIFTRWAIERDWAYHVSRLGSLVDEPVLDEIATVLEWSPVEKREVRRQSKELRLVRLWSKTYQQTGELPPQEVVDGYLVSSLVRGRYYQQLASLRRGNYIWHSFRNYVIEPITELTDLDLFNDRLVEVFLAGMICRGAMEERTDGEVIKSWADNIRRLRSRTLEIPREGDSEKALSLAVNLAKTCGVSIRWNKLDRILEGSIHYFVLPVVGIAAGVLTLLVSASHIAALAAHTGAEMLVKPYADIVAEKIDAAATGSTLYLKKLAESGAQRVFAITKDDLKRQITDGQAGLL